MYTGTNGYIADVLKRFFSITEMSFPPMLKNKLNPSKNTNNDFSYEKDY